MIKAYFAPALRRIANGAPVDEALRGLAARLDIIEFHMLVLTLEAGFRSADIRLEEAARTLGASRLTVFRRVTLPMVRPSLVR